ncbi:hypothetical protein DRO02_01675 [archaeon]|nr:MAG: hypothetical protein DRO02_01675 [archaeon]RLG65689.1 MAG: hypothetical protein DRO21_01310 [archaeon]HDM23566.1 DNA replication complex GINS family protein [Candidatus Bathyarchaeota archaeon]
MYEKLLKMLSDERDSETLLKLEKNFTSKVGEHLARLDKKIKRMAEDDVRRILLEKEREIITLAYEQLMKLRILKITIYAITGRENLLEEEHLTDEEKKFLIHLKKFIGQIRKNVLKREIDIEKELIVVRILKDIPEEIVGIDLKTYGPYKKEDVAAIPYMYAKILIDKGYAEPIEVDE